MKSSRKKALAPSTSPLRLEAEEEHVNVVKNARKNDQKGPGVIMQATEAVYVPQGLHRVSFDQGSSHAKGQDIIHQVPGLLGVVNMDTHHETHAGLGPGVVHLVNQHPGYDEGGGRFWTNVGRGGA